MAKTIELKASARSGAGKGAARAVRQGWSRGEWACSYSQFSVAESHFAECKPRIRTSALDSQVFRAVREKRGSSLTIAEALIFDQKSRFDSGLSRAGLLPCSRQPGMIMDQAAKLGPVDKLLTQIRTAAM